MSKKCDITGKKPSFGNNVPFSHKKTRRRWDPNIQRKRIWIPEMGRFVKIRLSTRALRSIDRAGLLPYLRKHNLKLKDVTS
ncbi:MAG: 50S ribosomal protein L28 [Chloroflexi bacterium]|nr:50S ribosomal protein L28 [Chloroflexota bacterium]MQC26987.1 50S ribosomal protein L28 [Chloroflexota bacterium]